MFRFECCKKNLTAKEVAIDPPAGALAALALLLALGLAGLALPRPCPGDGKAHCRGGQIDHPQEARPGQTRFHRRPGHRRLRPDLPHEIYITGRAAGTTNMILWQDKGRYAIYDLEVATTWPGSSSS
jgi:hypothetical protein